MASTAAVLGSTLGSAAAATASVSVVDNAYSPSVTSIAAGDSVTWSFVGSNNHSVTADPGQAITFDSHPTCGQGGQCGRPGQPAFTVVFAQAGSFAYFCRIHGGAGGVGMFGVVQVAAAPSPSASASPPVSPTPSSSPTVTPGDPPSPAASPSASFSPSASPSASFSASSSPSVSPAPSSSPTGTPQAPTLNAPTTAIAGVVIAVSGTAAPGSLVELFGVTAPNATLLKVNDTVADSSGVWTRTIRPLRNVTLQSRSQGRSSGTRFIAVSTAVRQSVAALAGCVVQVSGAVFEPKPGATVFLRALDSSGRTVSLGTGTVQSDGRFLLRRPYTCGMTLRVYAVIEGDNVNRPGATSTQTITTRR